MIAHRGLRMYENKIMFFPYITKRQNIRGIEFDVHRNSKNQLVVTHDHVDRDKLSSDFLLNLPEFPKTTMVVDIKTDNENAEDMAEQVLLELSQLSDHDWYVCSFNRKCVEKLKTIKSKCSIGYIHNGFLGPLNCEGYDFVSLYYKNISKKKVNYFHAMGIKVFAWTVPHDEVHNMISMGVDEIIVDTD